MAVKRVQLRVAFQYLDTNGKLIPVPNHTTVSVFNRNTAAPATVYAAETGGTLVSPLTTDSSGAISGWVVEGSYTLSVIANPGASPPYGGTTIAWEAVRGDGVESIYPGTITSAHLASSLTPFLLTPGHMLDFAGAVAPAGFVLCDGASYSTTGSYAALFAVIGYTFGGTGGNFNVPDCRARATIGTGTGTGGGAAGNGKPAGGNALTARARADASGSETHTITAAEMPVHNHAVYDPTHGHGVYDPGHQHYVSSNTGYISAVHYHQPSYASGSFFSTYSAGDGSSRFASFVNYVPWWGSTGYVTADHVHYYSNWTNGGQGANLSWNYNPSYLGVYGNVGAAAPYNLMQPFFVMNKIIKL